MLKYESVSELVAEAEKRNIKISELVLEDQAKSMEKEPLEGILTTLTVPSPEKPFLL